LVPLIQNVVLFSLSGYSADSFSVFLGRPPVLFFSLVSLSPVSSDFVELFYGLKKKKF